MKHTPKLMVVVFVMMTVLAGVPSFAQTPATEDDLAVLSDEFDDATTLENWTQFGLDDGWANMLKTADIDTTSPNHLYVEPYTSGWYADYYGVFLFKEIEGDFVATTRLHAKGKDADIPQQYWSLTGLMARTPRQSTPETWESGQENWVFITTGIAEEMDTPVFETKTTVNSGSELKLHPAPSGWVELRLARIDSHFILVYRADGETEWTLLEHFDRDDMPATLQVGLNAYTDWYNGIDHAARPSRFNRDLLIEGGEPDLVVLVDYVRFQRPILPEDFDPATADDEAFLAIINAQ